MSPFDAVAFTPFPLGPVTLRNRFIKAATFEGMTPGGVPSAALTELHRVIAAGGVAMTTVAYCAVSDEGRTFGNQMAMSNAVVPALQTLTEAVHKEGAHVAIQLGHAGFFTKHRIPGRRFPAGPSVVPNAYGIAHGMPVSRAMNRRDMDRVARDFARAAQLAQAAGFDALELHLGHGYLLSQFLCPATNRRTDSYGGALENRLRFPLEVVAAVRAAVGPDCAVLAKMNVNDGFAGGLTPDDAVGVARALEASEDLDALILSGGFASRSALYLLRGGRPLRAMQRIEKHSLQRAALGALGPALVKAYPYESRFLADTSRRIRDAVNMPLVTIGGIDSSAAIAAAMNDGFEFVQLGRPLVRDPQWVNRLARGEVDRSDCVRCNVCIAEMDEPAGLRCVMPPVRGVEAKRDGPTEVNTVLVTGGCGVIGRALVEELVRRGKTVRILDLDTDANRATAANLASPPGALVSGHFGDICDEPFVAAAIVDCDAVVHLAGMLPPSTDQRLERALAVNVGATDTLARLDPPLLVFASSYTVYGTVSGNTPPQRATGDPVRPTDQYTHHKVAAESLIRRAGGAHAILRFATVPAMGTLQADLGVVMQQFRVRPDAPMEMLHPEDAALAVANLLERPATWNRTLNIGGGPKCQIRQADLLGVIASVLGLDASTQSWTGSRDYYSQWLDTTESEALLGYQRHDWQGIRADLLGHARPLTRLLSPFKPASAALLALTKRWSAARTA